MLRHIVLPQLTQVTFIAIAGNGRRRAPILRHGFG